MAGVVCTGPKPKNAPGISKGKAPASAQKGKQEQEYASQEIVVGARLAQSVEQEQSMALVQIMLHASVSPFLILYIQISTLTRLSWLDWDLILPQVR